MGTKKRRDLPDRLEGLRRRFEQWRRTRKLRMRIPEPLWAALGALWAAGAVLGAALALVAAWGASARERSHLREDV